MPDDPYAEFQKPVATADPYAEFSRRATGYSGELTSTGIAAPQGTESFGSAIKTFAECFIHPPRTPIPERTRRVKPPRPLLRLSGMQSARRLAIRSRIGSRP